jgi:hypothetical protein
MPTRWKINALVPIMLGTAHSHDCGSRNHKGTICEMETLSVIMNKKRVQSSLCTRFKIISPYLLLLATRCTFPSNIFCLYKRKDTVLRNVTLQLQFTVVGQNSIRTPINKDKCWIWWRNMQVCELILLWHATCLLPFTAGLDPCIKIIFESEAVVQPIKQFLTFIELCGSIPWFQRRHITAIWIWPILFASLRFVCSEINVKTLMCIAVNHADTSGRAV